MQFIYNVLIIPLLYVAFWIGFLFNKKIRRGIQGRKNLFAHLKDNLQTEEKVVVWFHIASYGEFEQAKPVLNKLKAESPGLFIFVTFFSPSAYHFIKASYPVDFICYLPFDSFLNARKFISIVKPRLAVIVRHDIWPNFVWTLHKRKIPVILINASIPPKSSRFLPLIKTFNKKVYDCFTNIFTISNEESERIRTLVSSENTLIITGDTKFDQVYQRTLETEKIQHLLNHPFLKQKPIWAIGSSWPADERFILPAYTKLITQYKDLILLLIPHEPSEQRISEIEAQLKLKHISFIRHSQLAGNSTNFNVLIVDEIGLLANLYRLAKIAFVGGSFEYQVHNVLEPAVYGIPVLFGPKITSQHEALLLVQKKAGFIVNSVEEIVDKIIHFFTNEKIAAQAGKNAKQIVLEHMGATEKTTRLLLKYLS